MTRALDKIFEDYKPHLTVAEVGEILSVTTKTAYEYLQSGEIPSYRIGARWVILRDEVKDLMERRRQGDDE